MTDSPDHRANAASLSSIASQLDELTARLTLLADRYRAAKDSAVAEDLYGAERSLITARRAAARARAALEDRS